MYLILSKLLKNENKKELKAAILAFMSSIILASISNAVYIRMYALLTLEILITLYFHIKLSEKQQLDIKLLLAIGISVVSGILTHYYYLFYIVFLYLVFAVKYIRNKNIKMLLAYTSLMLLSGGISLLIFPYSIDHMFFGYRGQGVMSNFKHVEDIFKHLNSHIFNLNYYAFNNLLYVILGIIGAELIYIKIKKENVNIQNKEILRIIVYPALGFFIIAAIASPWRVLRYIVPICGLIFAIVIYILYKLVNYIFSEKTSNILIIVLFGAIILSPIVLKMEPELLFKDKKDIVKELSTELNFPTVYLFNPEKR